MEWIRGWRQHSSSHAGTPGRLVTKTSRSTRTVARQTQRGRKDGWQETATAKGQEKRPSIRFLRRSRRRDELQIMSDWRRPAPGSQLQNVQRKSPDDRAEAAKETMLCFSCLKGGHRSRECPESKVCGVDNCKKKHHKLLHHSKRVYNNPENSSQHLGIASHTRHSSRVLLQVVPVILQGPAKSCGIYVMFDLGSTCSLIQSSLADKLGLDGPEERMTLNGIQQQNSILSRKVSFHVSPSDNLGERWVIDQARTIHKFNLPKTTVDMSKEKERWPHLTDLDLPFIDGSRVTVLLGADAFNVIVSQEIRLGPKGTPEWPPPTAEYTKTQAPSFHDVRPSSGDREIRTHLWTRFLSSLDG